MSERAIRAWAGGWVRWPGAARRWLLRAGTLLVVATLFVVDAVTPADNVSLCFAYAIPITFGILDRRGAVFWLAALCSVLSIVGSFIQPPTSDIWAIFIANRVIAIATQWLVALLCHYRQETEALLRSRLQAEQAESARQRRFLSILLHEVNTPLTTIDGQSYRLGKLYQTISAEDVGVRAGKIRAAARRLGDIVKRIHLASSVEAADDLLPMDIRPVDPRRLLQEAVDQARETTDREIDLAFDEPPSALDGDADLLRQVFDNLLSNAVKFSGPGVPVSVLAARDGDDLLVRIVDKGHGIDAEDLPLLFTPYQRGRNSQGVPGAGLGLYLVRRFIEMHAGTIAIDSTPAHGTTVTVRVPVRRESPLSPFAERGIVEA